MSSSQMLEVRKEINSYSSHHFYLFYVAPVVGHASRQASDHRFLEASKSHWASAIFPSGESFGIKSWSFVMSIAAKPLALLEWLPSEAPARRLEWIELYLLIDVLIKRIKQPQDT